jgi:hypothetical protein
MRQRPSPQLPDLEDDATFRSALRPLIERTIPGNQATEATQDRISGHKDNQASPGSDSSRPARASIRPGKPDVRLSDESHNAGSQYDRVNGLLVAARRQAEVEHARGAKRRFEYLIPDRVGRALAADAASRGVSATTRLLEVLRDAGYPVIPEDLVDLRKMPRR